MTGDQALDGRALMEEARASEHGESYRTISKGKGFMLGVGARSRESGGEYFLEVTVQLCGPSAEVDIGSIEGALPLLKELRSRGYSMECREGSVTCERVLAASELGAELELVSAATHDLK
jgi:hypothetical protein